MARAPGISLFILLQACLVAALSGDARASEVSGSSMERNQVLGSVPGLPSGPASFDALAYSLDRLKESEAQYNVKCFTTFTQAQQALAMNSFGPGATERRAELVVRFGEALFHRALTLSRVSGDQVLSRGTLQRVFESILYAGIERDEAAGKWTVHIATGEPVEIQDPEFVVEKKLSEGWRSLIAMLERQRQEGDAASRFGADALDAMHEYLGLYDVLLLRLSGRLSREAGRYRILPSDVDDADKLLRSELGYYIETGTVDPRAMRREGFLRFYSIAFAETKAADVEASKGHLTEAEKKTHVESLAQMAMGEGAMDALVLDALPAIARAAWRRAQLTLASDEPVIGGRPMAGAIEEAFPYRADEDENIEFFPLGPTPVRVYSVDADSFRNEPFWWQILARMLRDELKPEDESGPKDLWAPLDPYGSDELAELMANLAVPLLREAARRAKDAGRAAISPADLSASAAYFLDLSSRARPLPPPPAPAPKAPSKTRQPKPVFTDVTDGSGLFSDPVERDWNQITMLGKEFNGLAVIDYDGDGLPDLFVCGGVNRLFKNLGGFKFKDVTEEAGVGGEGCKGASSADYDNDGRPDLLVLGSGREGETLKLFRNVDGKRFEDVTSRAIPSTAPAVSVSAAWLDYNHDGKLDLFLVNYGLHRRGVFPTLGNSKNGSPKRLLRNNGDGTFSDVTAEAGVGDTGWGLAAQAFDYDNDGWTDIYLANDFGRSLLFRNMKDGTFKDVSREAGVDTFGHAMGVSVADVTHSGFLDILVTNIGMYVSGTKYIRPNASTPIQYTPPLERNARIREANRLYINKGNGRFEDAYDRYVEPAPTGWGWNGMFFDYDNDGDPDVYIVNGLQRTSFFYNNERKVLLHWNPDRRMFVDVSSGSGANFAGNSQGAAFADFDRRGRLDLVVVGQEGVKILRNDTDLRGRHWLQVRLVGTRSNRDGFGAKVKVSAGAWSRWQEFGTGGGGFAASSERVAHFGLGARPAVDLEVRWPSGAVSRFKGVQADRRITVTEGKNAL